MVAFKVFTKSLGRTFWLNQDIFIPLKQCRKVRRKAVAFVRYFSDSEPNVVKSSYPPVQLPQMPLHEYVFENLHRWENKIALECGVSGRKVTYRDFYNSARILARSLQKKFKLKKGDYLFVMLPNCPEYPSIFMAASMAGIVTTTANPLYTPKEISHQIDNTQPKIIFTAPELYGNCMEALNTLKKQLPIVVVKFNPSSSIPPGTVDFSEVATSSTPENPDPVDVDISSNVILPFSSGTSGHPKGVELSHKNITANLAQLGQHSFYKYKSDKENDQTVSLAILPMFHIYGMVAITFDSLSTGEHLITLSKFEPKLFVDTIYTKKTGLLFLVPPLVFFLANQSLVEKKHLENVNCVVSGAASCGALDIEGLRKKTPSHTLICQGYGMTETSPVITFTHNTRTHKIGSVGCPLSLTRIKVADIETGKVVPRGTTGEIRVKGPQVMKGYLNLPKVTEESFDSDGWLKTGDIGYVDDEGDLFVCDRMKELIKVKGFQVAPAEIEETLRSHPKIADVGVIGIPHPSLGEVPKAYITLKQGVTMAEEEAVDFVKKHLSSYKQLQGGVAFIDAIPRNSAGKILRKTLRDLQKKSE